MLVSVKAADYYKDCERYFIIFLLKDSVRIRLQKTIKINTMQLLYIM